MFERFTEQARQVVVLAQEKTRMLGHDRIGTEHLLLGLLREEGGVPARALAPLGVTADRVRAEIVRAVGLRDSQRSQIPFTPRAKQLLTRSLHEALSLGHNHIGTEHFLLAIAGFEEASATRILVGFGVGRDDITQSVMGMLTGPGGEQRRDAAAASPDPSTIPDATSTP